MLLELESSWYGCEIALKDIRSVFKTKILVLLCCLSGTKWRGILQILFCDFVNGTKPVLLVGVDIIIFDIGLFHSLWGIDSCVAQHLDGGYGRFGWCFFHIAAFIICLPFAFVSRPKPYSLWPLLIQVNDLLLSFSLLTFLRLSSSNDN